ncbi:hypothetical protein MCOR17_008050 [Pyricularia oryzae]|nr:hypothetical protein MCOR17_008050 [Pyricularia oryzae]
MLDRGGLYKSRRGRALSAYTTVNHRRIIVPHHELVNQQQGLEEVVLRPLNPVGSIYEVEAVMEMTKDFNLAQALSSIFTVNGRPASYRQELNYKVERMVQLAWQLPLNPNISSGWHPVSPESAVQRTTASRHSCQKSTCGCETYSKYVDRLLATTHTWTRQWKRRKQWTRKVSLRWRRGCCAEMGLYIRGMFT